MRFPESVVFGSYSQPNIHRTKENKYGWNFCELHRKAIVCLIYFLALTIIPILVHAGVAWQSTAEGGFNRAIHNIQNSPFRTKFERDMQEFNGQSGHRLHLGSRTRSRSWFSSHLGTFAITTVGKINNMEEHCKAFIFSNGNIAFSGDERRRESTRPNWSPR